ncbi:replication protein P [Halopseudomonas sp.]|uniref:replication protein P n=1 Tax=Halopseudomonas sp. TaxID=2901191 RepID=UPI00311D4F1E
MDKIDDLTEKAAGALMAGQGLSGELLPPDAGGHLDDATVDVVNRLFASLCAIKPAYRQAWPDNKALGRAKKEWARAFMAAGIDTLEHLRFGLEACRLDGSDFVPSAGRFIELCTPEPERMGLPSMDAAYQQALRNSHPASIGSERWDHPAVYHATLACTRTALLSLPTDRSRSKFERAYRDIQNRLLRGEVLAPTPPNEQKAIPRIADPAVGRAALAGLRAAMGGANA